MQTMCHPSNKLEIPGYILCDILYGLGDWSKTKQYMLSIEYCIVNLFSKPSYYAEKAYERAGLSRATLEISSKISYEFAPLKYESLCINTCLSSNLSKNQFDQNC